MADHECVRVWVVNDPSRGWCDVCDRPMDEPDEALECLDGPTGCEGPVEYRMALSGTGRSFPRCDRHWDERLDRQQEIQERYFGTPSSHYCKHGNYIGDPFGADYICGPCENGE